uniref:Uncharacterized protein n=1 Tax=Magallana gigas TaxID=29159 RepID=A0A8W8MKM1_MAGGI
MPRGKPKANKDKGATCSGAGSRTRKRRAESKPDFQQPTFSAIQFVLITIHASSATETTQYPNARLHYPTLGLKLGSTT